MKLLKDKVSDDGDEDNDGIVGVVDVLGVMAGMNCPRAFWETFRLRGASFTHPPLNSSMFCWATRVS